jgi:hypothetical protein
MLLHCSNCLSDVFSPVKRGDYILCSNCGWVLDSPWGAGGRLETMPSIFPEDRKAEDRAHQAFATAIQDWLPIIRSDPEPRIYYIESPDADLRAMRPTEVDQLLAQGEGQCIEFKTSFGEEREALESICSFLNADGGHVLLGVRDDREIVGVTLGAKKLEELAAKIKRLFDPQAEVAIHKVEMNDKTVVVLAVPDGHRRNVYFLDGRAWIRVGSTNTKMTAHQIQARYLEPRE